MKRIITVLTGIIFCLAASAQYYQQSPKLTATGLPSSANFGVSLSLSSDASTAIAGAWGGTNGAAGQAVIINRTGSNWTQGQTLIGMGSIGGANQGNSVAISADGNTAIVGGPNDNGGVGAAWIFIRSGGTWTQQAKLVGTGATGNAMQGYCVAISGDGNTVLIGAPKNNTHVGAAWVFTRSGSTWIEQTILIGSGSVSSVSYPSEQGYCVALSTDGNTAMIGGRYDGGAKGAVWAFSRSGSTWTQQGGKISGSILQPIGTSLALSADGNVGVIGAAAADSKTGGAYVVTRSAGVWTAYPNILQGTLPVGHAQQGSSVAISSDGKRFVMGGAANIFTAGSGDIGVGACWVFKFDGSNWVQEGNKYVGTGNIGNSQQGASVAMSADGNSFITGGFGDDGGNGAVWVFSTTIPPATSIEMYKIAGIKAYPNPVANTLFISHPDGVSIELVSWDGRILISRNNQTSFDLTNFPNGVYIINYYLNDRSLVQSEKIIKYR